MKYNLNLNRKHLLKNSCFKFKSAAQNISKYLNLFALVFNQIFFWLDFIIIYSYVYKI